MFRISTFLHQMTPKILSQRSVKPRLAASLKKMYGRRRDSAHRCSASVAIHPREMLKKCWIDVLCLIWLLGYPNTHDLMRGVHDRCNFRDRRWSRDHACPLLELGLWCSPSFVHGFCVLLFWYWYIFLYWSNTKRVEHGYGWEAEIIYQTVP